MIEIAQASQEFKSLNRRDILDFPLQVPMGIDMLCFLEDTFDKYYHLVDHICNTHKVDSSQIDLDRIVALGNTLIEVLCYFRKGKIAEAYFYFEKQMEKNYELLPLWSLKDGDFYRMRKKRDIKRISQLYPLPPELRYLSGGMRFSIPGYSCLYLGHSESVCKLEISSTGSMIKIKPKENVEFNLVDLTFSDDMLNGRNKEELKFIHSWPLIASCYIDQFYCLRGKCICPPEGVNFNEKYIIPQFLTTYIRKCHVEINGIRYYTVKNDNIDPFGRDEKDMRNIVLYIDSSSDQSYDAFIDNFEWSKPYNV